MGLAVATRSISEWAVVELDGEVDFCTSDRVTGALDEAGTRSAWVIVDCARLVFCDSGCLSTLITGYKLAQSDAGGRTLVVAAALRWLADLLTRTGADQEKKGEFG